MAPALTNASMEFTKKIYKGLRLYILKGVLTAAMGVKICAQQKQLPISEMIAGKNRVAVVAAVNAFNKATAHFSVGI